MTVKGRVKEIASCLPAVFFYLQWCECRGQQSCSPDGARRCVVGEFGKLEGVFQGPTSSERPECGRGQHAEVDYIPQGFKGDGKGSLR